MNRKMIWQMIKRVFLNDTLWCVIGTVAGVTLAFVDYFSNDILKAIFWMLCALVCIMNMKEK